MRSPVFTAVALLALLAAATDARAQNFFGGGAASFDPEIDIVESGALLDAQATVSHDRKYVTITAQPQLSRLLSLQPFAFQGSGTVGFGGGAQPPQQPNANGGQQANAPARPNGGNGGRNGPLMPALARPAEPKAAAPVLHKEGMTRVDQPTAAVAAPATQPTVPVRRPPELRSPVARSPVRR